MPSVPSAISFRDATLSDAAAVITLVQSAYRGEASRAGWTTEADLLGGNRTDADAVRTAVRAAGSVLMLACRTGTRPAGPGHVESGATARADELVACCQLTDEGGGRGYFGMFAVRPDRQGAGIGRVVLAEAERRVVTEWQCSLLRMTVIRQRADLIAWYERRGFALTGTTIPFPYGDSRFGRPKRPGLEFVELAKVLG